MASPNPSKSTTPEPSSIVAAAANGNASPFVLGESYRTLNGSVGILWDIENCPVPNGVQPEDVAGNIRMALHIHPVIKGAVTMFSAYGDFNIFPRRLREGCQRTGVKLVDVPNGKKDAADKAILVDMFLFALDNPPPSSILLISGDVDFAPALHILGQRGYTIILIIPDKVGVSPALSNAGRFVWDWPSVARGEGFVPPKNFLSRGMELVSFPRGWYATDSIDGPYEEEVLDKTRGSHCPSIMYNTNPTTRHCSNSTSAFGEAHEGFYPGTKCVEHSSDPVFAPVTSRCIPSETPSNSQSLVKDDVSWVQPGDLEGLKVQLMRLLEMSGGSLPLVRVPSEYIRNYGRPLYVSEYGAVKLVNLIKKMGSNFTVVGKGHDKMLCLHNPGFMHDRPSPWMTKVKGGNIGDSVNMGACNNIGNTSDGFSDDEKAGNAPEDGDGTSAAHANFICDEHRFHLDRFKQEVQELLVCYSCRLLLSSFKLLYERRYKKCLDYRNYGVESLEDLIARVSDVVVLHEDKLSKRRYLVSRCWSGKG